jgi:hypothetical protein
MKLTIITLPVQNMNSKIAIRQISKRFLFRHVQYSWYKIKQKEEVVCIEPENAKIGHNVIK